MSNQNLSFINSSGPEAFKRDAQSRKQVRSHVMKEFRRKERSGAHTGGPSSVHSSSRSPTPSDRARRAQNVPDPSGHDIQVAAQHGESSEIESHHLWDPLIGALEESPMRVQDDFPEDAEHVISTESYPYIQSEYESAVAALRRTPSPFLQPSDSLSTLRNNFYSSPTPFTHPACFEMLLDINAKYLNLVTYHLGPNLWISPVRESCSAGYFRDGSEMQITLFTNWLFYTLYVKGKYGKSHPLDGRWKQEVLKRIHSRLQKKEEAVQFDTIGGVAGLVGWENRAPSGELQIHLRGLKHLVGMIGERTLEESGFRPMIFCQNYISAVCANARPVLVDPPTVPQLYHIDATLYNTPFNTFCPLLSFPDNSLASDGPLPRVALEEAFNAFETLYLHSNAPHTLLVTFGDRSIAKLQNLKADTENASVDVKIGQACRLAAQIHIRAASRLISHRDESNHEDVQQLYSILQTLDIHDWKHMPYVLIWVLLTGLAAGIPGRSRCLFLAELMRLTYTIGINWFGHFELICGNFLWLQAMIRGDLDVRASSTMQSER